LLTLRSPNRGRLGRKISLKCGATDVRTKRPHE
jgi:hypothetical protein